MLWTSSILLSKKTNVNRPIIQTSRQTNQIINVLLLGESGVGKSTFINAFPNYLTFQSLEEAENNSPIVLIPVSFLITVGYNFDERIVQFGGNDNDKNENFNDRGESVTQKCQKYFFNHPSSEGKRVCIIDTPGFGDTRGVVQDQKNMRHILRYIDHLPRLDAICFLLKPNEARLNIAVRSCFTQFARVFRQNVHQKIIFCFTNSRGTFYAPGNTGPLLKKMLSDLEMNNVSLRKQNTFCFDSEAFRYLVAKQDGVEFTSEEKEPYENSWKRSFVEAKRLIDYITTLQEVGAN